MNAQPPPHSLDSVLERRNKLNPYAGFGDVPQFIQLGARSCTQHSSMNLIKEETTQRNPNEGWFHRFMHASTSTFARGQCTNLIILLKIQLRFQWAAAWWIPNQHNEQDGTYILWCFGDGCMVMFLLARGHQVRSFAAALAMLATLIYLSHRSLHAPRISHHLIHLRGSTYKFLVIFQHY
jgi:hypothetical protein